MQNLSRILFCLVFSLFACTKGKTESGASAAITAEQTLSKLIVNIDDLNPPFDPFVTRYTLAGGETANNKMNINAAPVSSKIKIQVNGVDLRADFTTDTLALEAGKNTFTIDLLDAAKTKVNTYILEVQRAQELADQEISGITTSDGEITPDFSPNITSYQLLVGKDTSDLTVSPAPYYPELSTVVVNGKSYSGDIGSYDVLVQPGNTTVTIEIKGSSGRTKTYTIIVTRPTT